MKTHWCGQGLIQHTKSYLGDKYGVDDRIVLKVLQNLHSFTLRSWPVNERSKSSDISQYIKAWRRQLEITDMNHITYFFNFSAYFLRANTLSENTMTLSFRLKKGKYITKFAGVKRQTFLGWRFYNTLHWALAFSFLPFMVTNQKLRRKNNIISTWNKVKEKNSFVPNHSMLNIFPVFKIYETFLIYSLWFIIQY